MVELKVEEGAFGTSRRFGDVGHFHVSIIQNEGSAGGSMGFYEMRITAEIGWLTEEDVQRILKGLEEI